MSFEQRLDAIQVSRVCGFKNTPSASATRRRPFSNGGAKVGLVNISSQNDLPFGEHRVAYGFLVQRVRNLGRWHHECDGLLDILIFDKGAIDPTYLWTELQFEITINILNRRSRHSALCLDNRLGRGVKT